MNQNECQKLREIQHLSPWKANTPPRQAFEPLKGSRQSAYSGCETSGRALVEVLPIVIFGETGKQQVMALRDSGCNRTLIDESLAFSLGLQGKEVDLEIQIPAHQEMRCRTSRKRGSQVLFARCEDNS